MPVERKRTGSAIGSPRAPIAGHRLLLLAVLADAVRTAVLTGLGLCRSGSGSSGSSQQATVRTNLGLAAGRLAEELLELRSEQRLRALQLIDEQGEASA